MRRASVIQKEMGQIVTVKDLTGVFESISSTRIAKVRTKVEVSTSFFDRLWKLYVALRLDPGADFRGGEHSSGRQAYVMISAEGGLSGDIDLRLIEAVLSSYDPATTDLIVIGGHGTSQLTQRGIPYKYSFRVPTSENYIDVSPILKVISDYTEVRVYYEAYISLGVQEIKQIDLVSQVKTMSADVEADLPMTDVDTVFEPSLDAIIDQMEKTMMGLAFSQVILESGLAQDASRFNAMVVAKKRSSDLVTEYNLDYHRSKRSESDRRLREVMTSLKKKKHRV